jgi:hypothetical protein
MAPRRARRAASTAVAWSRAILLGLLAATGEFAYIMLSTPYKGVALLPRRRTSGYYQARRQLERAGFVRRSPRSRQRYVLTRRGKARAVEHLLRYATTLPVTRWDGKWRVVIFDVSERRRSARDFLRRQLAAMGFRQLHRSVWVGVTDPPPMFRALLAESGLLSSSRSLLVEAMDYDRDLRQQFGLLRGTRTARGGRHPS